MEKNLRIAGIMTFVMGALYFPNVLGILWGLKPAPLGLMWSGIQILIGVILSTKDFLSLRIHTLLINFLYHLIWGFLIIDYLITNPDLLVGHYLYLLHLVISIYSGWYYLKYRVLANECER